MFNNLPASCSPTTPLLQTVSSVLGACIPTPLALLSTVLGVLSITAWLFAQLPQIVKNFQARSTSGLSILFLAEWLLGDLTNLLGSMLTYQATWQVVLASYYCSVDFVLVGQWMWYEHLRHGRVVRRLKWWRRREDGSVQNERRGRTKKRKAPHDFLDPSSAVVASASRPIATPNKRFLSDLAGSPTPRYPVGIPGSLPGIPQLPLSFPGTPLGTSPAGPSTGRVLRPSGSRSPLIPGASPSTSIVIILLVAVLAQASPLDQFMIETTHKPPPASLSESVGRILSWVSTFLYLASRLPQLLHNYTRRSTSGLSPILFAAAFFGNLFYSSSLLANPSLWSSFSPYDPDIPGSGGYGWTPNGSSREKWALNAAPFFLGAAGVLAMDAAIGVQFMMYGDGDRVDAAGKHTGERVVLVVEAEPGARGPSRWMRVNGWMRGWMPAATKSGKARIDEDGFESGTDAGTETDVETEPDTDIDSDAGDERTGLLSPGRANVGYGSA
jgi:uncharacterized protein with PQ loop repeat